MRIGWLLPTIKISGGIKVVLTYAQKFAASGHTVDVIVLSDEEYDLWAGEMNFTIYHCKDIGYLARLFDGVTFDALICTFWSTVYVARSNLLSASKIFYFVQGDEPDFYPAESQDYEAARRTYSGREHKVTVSNFLKDRIRSYQPDAEVTVIPNGIDPPGSNVQPLLNRGRKLRVLVEGKLNDQLKRTDETLRLLELIQGIEVIAVTPSLDEPLRPIADLLLRAVPAERMGIIYASCDVIVKLSRTEGFSLPVLEAMSYGLIPIMTDYGGNRDYIIDGKNGVVVTELTSEAIYGALNNVLLNFDEMKREVINTASEYYWNDHDDRFLKLIEGASENGTAVDLRFVMPPVLNGRCVLHTSTRLLESQHCFALRRRVAGWMRAPDGSAPSIATLMIGSEEVVVKPSIERPDISVADKSAAERHGFAIDTPFLGPITPKEARLEVKIEADHGYYSVDPGFNFSELFVESEYDYTVRINGKSVKAKYLYEVFPAGSSIELDYDSIGVRLILRAKSSQ